MRLGCMIGYAAVVALAASACGSGSSGGSSAGGSSHRGGTMIMLSNASWGTLDPAKNYTVLGFQSAQYVDDGLVGFRRAAGVAGTAIVPDLATTVPKPTDGGKTYVFHLRKGIRYSNGAPVKPSDFATVFKRQFTVPGPANSFYAGHRRRRRHARRAVGRATCRRASSRTTQPARSPSTSRRRIRSSWTSWRCRSSSPCPARHPPHDMGNTPIPGTGPYMWKSYQPEQGRRDGAQPALPRVVGGRPARRATRARSSSTSA